MSALRKNHIRSGAGNKNGHRRLQRKVIEFRDARDWEKINQRTEDRGQRKSRSQSGRYQRAAIAGWRSTRTDIRATKELGRPRIWVGTML
jgi:hypothetical protein